MLERDARRRVITASTSQIHGESPARGYAAVDDRMDALAWSHKQLKDDGMCGAVYGETSPDRLKRRNLLRRLVQPAVSLRQDYPRAWLHHRPSTAA